jgi:hypothetical protein
MKKGLLTVLLSSLVLVGCQNYDDQFDDLNAQISALKSQVDGLAALTGQVSSLSASVSSLQSGIAAATAAANAAGTAATAAGASADSNATAIAAATAAATAAGASADAATAAAEAATTAATAAVAAGATNATAIAEATAAATAAGASADAATAAAEAATTAANTAITQATTAATNAAAATTAATTAGTDAVAAAATAAAAAVTAGENATAAAAAAETAATAAGATASEAAALATAAAEAATTAATAAGTTASANTASLTALAAEVDAVAAALAAVQASLATVSTAEDLAALQAEVTAIEADIEELMNSSNVYQGGVTVNSATTLDAVHALGNSINIVNGDVAITNLATYDQTKIQAIINRMVTVNGSYTYTGIADAASANTASPSFNTLTSVGDVIMTEVNGAISFAALETAGEITITGDSWDHDGDEAATTAAVQAITSFSAPLLASVDAVNVNDTDGINLATVGTAININSVSTFADVPGSLDITFTSGGTLTAAALTTPLAGGDETFALTLAGLSSYTAPAGITGGTLTVSETPTLAVTGFQGTIDINTGVTSFTGTDVTNVDVAGADELVTATIDYAAEGTTHASYDATDVTAQGEGLATLTITAANSDLSSVTVSGNLEDINIDDYSGTDLTVSATMAELNVATSDDLVNVDLSDATIGDIIFNDNDAMTALTIDNATNLAYTGNATAETGLTLTVTNSGDLTSLTVTGDSFDDVDITGNGALAAIDLSGMTAVGAGANVQISANDLNAASITETSASAVTGSIDDGTSGMDTLDALFTALTAQLAAVATVRFDSAETITEEAGEVNNGNDVNFGDADDDLLVVYVKAAGTTGGNTTVGTQTTAVGVFDLAADDDLVIAVNGVNVDFGDMTGDIAADLAIVQASAGISTALAAGAIVTAKRGYNSSSSVTLATLTKDATALVGERYTTTAAVTAASSDTNADGTSGSYGLGKADAYTLTIGDESVTATFSTDAAATPVAIVDAWDAAWPATSNVTISQTAGSIALLGSNLTFDVNAVSSILDSSSYDLAISISVTDSTTASSMSSNALDYTIGSTRATNDNSTVDAGFIMQFTSTAAGATNNSIVTIAAGTGNDPSVDVMTAVEAPEDGETAVDGVTTASTTGVSTDLTSWL